MNFIHKFIQRPFHGISLLFSLVIPIITILKSKNGISLKKINFIKNNKKCIVLGNGPSLKEDLDVIKKHIEDYDFCCVNNFVLSPYFDKFKPTKYIFQDTYFWQENAHEDWIKQRNETYLLLNEKVHWDMQVFIPMHADKAFFEQKITNPKIEIIQLKVAGMRYVQSNFAYKLFDSGYFGPCRWNVLITAVYLSIYTKYDEISIYGADMSFYKDVDVDQKTNDLILKTKHFYGEAKYDVYTHNPEKTRKVTMHELMDTQACIFFAHEVLSGYANKLKINIVNRSSYSLIDAYKRK